MPTPRVPARVLPPLALLALALLSGCAGTGPGPGGSGPRAGQDTLLVLDVRLRQSAELVDGLGALRVFDRDLRVEYRAGGRGPGLEAGEVTLEEEALQRVVGGGGSVEYRLGRGDQRTSSNPWVSLANTGGPAAPAARVRLKLAHFPEVTRPGPGLGVGRDDELAVVMLPPVPEVWYRVSLTGSGDPVTATDLGEGRWLFPRGSLAGLGPGRARIVIEVETSCADCPGAGLMRARWSSRAELEVPVTLF